MLQDEIEQLQADLADFKLASQELEKELEADLELSQRQIDDLNAQLVDSARTIDMWKLKYATLKSESTAAEEVLKQKLQQAVTEQTRAQHKIRAIEIENDDIERSERIAKTTVQELEELNAELLEKLAISDSALAATNEQLQRTRDELRETADELQATKASLKRGPSNVEIKKRTLRRMEGIRHQVENIEEHIEVVRRFSAQPAQSNQVRQASQASQASQPAKREITRQSIRTRRPTLSLDRGRDTIPDLRAIASTPRSVSPGAGHGKPLA